MQRDNESSTLFLIQLRHRTARTVTFDLSLLPPITYYVAEYRFNSMFFFDIFFPCDDAVKLLSI